MESSTMSDVIPIESTLDDEATMKPRRMQEETDMDITPMIDITFLLLIFFLVASRMDPSGGVELPKARHGTAVQTKAAAVITVKKGQGEQIDVFTGAGGDGGELLDSSDLARQEEQIVQFIDEELNATVPKEYVLIKAARDVKHREVARIAKAVGQIPDVPLYVAVLEEQ